MTNLYLPDIPTSPMYENGVLTIPWHEFFRTLFTRVGGENTISLDDLLIQILGGMYEFNKEDYAKQIKDLQTQIDLLENDKAFLTRIAKLEQNLLMHNNNDYLLSKVSSIITLFKSYQLITEKDTASGYAGLNASSRTTKGVDTSDDVIVDLATKGLVIKDAQATPHYWRIGIDHTGPTLTMTDLGTSKP